MADLSDARRKGGDAKRYRAEAERMKETVREHGWDGEWFVRAYDALGRKVGSKENAEGQIFIESQGMCVMAGIGLKEGMAQKALESVNKRLATKHGIVLNQPAFTRYYIEYGEISSYPPGYKENAGIFCHNNPWIIIAETLAGNGDRAFDYYSRINPSAREAISDLHRCEPYVYAQMIAGRDAPTHGEAKNSWLTGTAAWNFYAVTQFLLGIRPTLERAADRAGHPLPLDRIPCRPQIPRRDVFDRRQARGEREFDFARGGRQTGGRGRRSAARDRLRRGEGRGDDLLDYLGGHWISSSCPRVNGHPFVQRWLEWIPAPEKSTRASQVHVGTTGKVAGVIPKLSSARAFSLHRELTNQARSGHAFGQSWLSDPAPEIAGRDRGTRE